MTDYTDLPLPQLTVLLKERSLVTEGTKDMLISRLEAYDAMNDTSPSPELHHSPAFRQTQTHKSTLPGSSHFSAEMEKEYELDWDQYADIDSEAVRAAKAATVELYEAEESDASSKSKSKSVPKSESLTATTSNGARSSATKKSDSNTVDLAEADTATDVSPSSLEGVRFALADPTGRVTKTGFKYKSLAASLYPDAPKAVTNVTEDVSLNVLSKDTLETPQISSEASSIPSSTSSTDTLAESPSVASSKAPLLATPTTAAKTVTTPMTTVTPNKNSPTQSTIDTIKTTKSGFRFNSIASLFSTSTESLVANPIKPPATPSQSHPKPIHNIVLDTASIHASGSNLHDQDDEAKKLALRAKRFGITPKEENEAAVKLRRQARFGLSEVVDDKSEKEKNTQKEKEQIRLQKIEAEKEKEREKVRQRVTASNKRQRQEDDNDRRQGRYAYKRYHQDDHYSSSSTYYGRRRRY